MVGTPGACSQVFCHPIKCMLMRSYRQRHVRYTIVRTTTTTTTTTQLMAAVLETFTHHSALRGQKTTRDGEGRGSSCSTWPSSGRTHPPAGALQAVQGRARPEAACQPGRAARAARLGPAAHRGAVRRRRSHVQDSRRSCAADGGPADGDPEERRRAGDRGAQDLTGLQLAAHVPLRAAAAGGTAGGSA